MGAHHLRPEVLLAPHHGSGTSSGTLAELVRKTVEAEVGVLVGNGPDGPCAARDNSSGRHSDTPHERPSPE